MHETLTMNIYNARIVNNVAHLFWHKLHINHDVNWAQRVTMRGALCEPTTVQISKEASILHNLFSRKSEVTLFFCVKMKNLQKLMGERPIPPHFIGLLCLSAAKYFSSTNKISLAGVEILKIGKLSFNYFSNISDNC
jgi:hypothetical protein